MAKILDEDEGCEYVVPDNDTYRFCDQTATVIVHPNDITKIRACNDHALAWHAMWDGECSFSDIFTGKDLSLDDIKKVICEDGEEERHDEADR